MKSLRERIGLKILRLIDRCIDSFEKRIFLFIFFLCLYWLWQNVWQLILFGKLFFVTDYESLFHIQSTLSMYQSSVFIRILYYVISNPNLNVLKLISCIKLIDILAILGVILLIKKFRIVVIFNGIKYVWGLFWVVKALNSKKCIFGNFLFKMAFFRAFYKYVDCFYSFTVYAFKNDYGL